MSDQAVPRPKSKRAAGPHIPPDYILSDVMAIQALSRGEADEQQQKRALDWIINQVAGTYEFQYYPSERDTAFALGRAFVGQQVIKLLKMDPTLLRRRES